MLIVLQDFCKMILSMSKPISVASIGETWNNVQSLPSDVKELIPEFYQPEMADFLINRAGLNLGIQQDGSKVNRVELPPWAEGMLQYTLIRVCLSCRSVTAQG